MKHTTGRKYLSIVLTLAMIISLFPAMTTVALAADTYTFDSVDIGENNVNSASQTYRDLTVTVYDYASSSSLPTAAYNDGYLCVSGGGWSRGNGSKHALTIQKSDSSTFTPITVDVKLSTYRLNETSPYETDTFRVKGYNGSDEVIASRDYENVTTESNITVDFSAFSNISKLEFSLDYNDFGIANLELGNPNTAPTFVDSGDGSLMVARNAGATDIKSLLYVNDADSGQTLTWLQSTAPSHGTLSLFSATASSGSTSIAPGGTITYSPNADYLGPDSFTVQVSDGTATAMRTVNVTVENTAPTITSATYNASTNVLAVTGTNISTDTDAIDTSKLTLTGEGGGTYTLTSANVTASSATDFSVTLNDADRLYVSGLLNKNGAVSAGGTTYNLAAADDWNGPITGDDISDLTGNGITVSGVNAAPVIANLNGDSVTFIEGGSAVFLDNGGDTAVTDSDSANFDGGNLTVSVFKNPVPGEDALSIANNGTGAGQIGVSGSDVTYGGTTIGTFTGGTNTDNLVVTFNTDATPDAATALIKALTYSNTNTTDPSTSARTVRVTLSDGSGGSSANADVTVNVTAVNNAPTLSASAATPTFTENGAAVALFSGAAVSTIEVGQTITSLTLTVTNVANGASEILNIDGTAVALTNGNSVTTTTNSMSVSVSKEGGTATVTLTKVVGVSTTNMATLINGITYRNTSENPTTSSRVITLTSIQDNGGTANGGVDATSPNVASTVTIVGINDAPTITAPGSISVTEDMASALVGISFSDVDAGDASVTVTLSVSSGTLAATSGHGVAVGGTGLARTLTGSISDMNAFISGSNLTFTTAANATADVTLSVLVNDGGNTGGGPQTASTTVTLAVTAVNDAPSFAKGSDITALENCGAQSRPGWATAISAGPADESGQTVSFHTSNDNNALFSVQPAITSIGTLTFTPAANANGTATVTVTLHDNGGTANGGADTSAAQTFTITINNVNEAPTDIGLSSASVSESAGIGTTVGNLSTTDPNAADTFTYTLVAGEGSADNASFTIDGNALKTNTTFRYATKNSYSIRVKTTDAGGLTYEKVFTINITDYNKAPTDITLSTTSINENVAANTSVGTLSSTDPDAGSTFVYSLVAGAGSTDNGSFNISGNTLRITNSPDYETKNSYSVRIRTTDQGGLTYEKIFTITVNNQNEAPVITTGATVSVTEGSTAAFTAAAEDPEGRSITWTITGGADQAKFSIVASTGVVSFVTAPAFESPTDADANNTYVLQITASDGALTATQTVTVTVTRRPSSGGSSTTGPSTNTTIPPTNTVIEVNGQKQDAGTASTQTTGGQTVTTIKVDDTKLNKILDAGGEKPTVTLPTNKASDVVVGELNGQTVKNMEQKKAILEIKTESVSYTLSAARINIDDVSSQIGEQVALKDIKVSVKIAQPPAEMVKIVENTAAKNSYQIVVKPVEFEITCTSGSKAVAVSKFNGYVERTVAIPDGIDPSKITTGIVLNKDGTFSHVPTQVVVINGKYYAKINSLTNSTYSVIYNPVAFADVASHWAKEAINDMGSRMVVRGLGNNSYEPERRITRAEYAAIVVRALGLRPGTEESGFGDVALSDWFNGYVDTATDYALITGYGSGTFRPSGTITREQAMAIIARAMKLTELSEHLTDKDVDAILAKYTDGAAVSDYAKHGVAACVKSGIVSGTSERTLSPKAYVTRAQVAVMIQHLLEKSGLI